MSMAGSNRKNSRGTIWSTISGQFAGEWNLERTVTNMRQSQPSKGLRVRARSRRRRNFSFLHWVSDLGNKGKSLCMVS